MNASIAQAQYSIDTQESELSILRMASYQIHEAAEKIDNMLATAKSLGATTDLIAELNQLVGSQPTERSLSIKEFSQLEELLVQSGLERLGILPDQYGIVFGMSRERGDGTIPVASLETIIFAFREVLANIRKNSFGDLTFNGVVELTGQDRKDKIALTIRHSEIKVQRPTIVWEDVEDLVFTNPATTDLPVEDHSQVKKENVRVPSNGPFTKCWGSN